MVTTLYKVESWSREIRVSAGSSFGGSRVWRYLIAALVDWQLLTAASYEVWRYLSLTIVFRLLLVG